MSIVSEPFHLNSYGTANNRLSQEFSNTKQILDVCNAAKRNGSVAIVYTKIEKECSHLTYFRVRFENDLFTIVLRRTFCEFFKDQFQRLPRREINTHYHNSQSTPFYAVECVAILNDAVDIGEHLPLDLSNLTCLSQEKRDNKIRRQGKLTTNFHTEKYQCRKEVLFSETLLNLSGDSIIVVDFDNLLFNNPMFNDSPDSTSFHFKSSLIRRAINRLRTSLSQSSCCLIVAISNQTKKLLEASLKYHHFSIDYFDYIDYFEPTLQPAHIGMSLSMNERIENIELAVPISFKNLIMLTAIEESEVVMQKAARVIQPTNAICLRVEGTK